MKEIEIPDSLANLVQASGAELHAFVVEAIEEKLSHRVVAKGKNLAALIDQGWIPPVVHGTAREDGEPWSQIEAPCNPA